MSITSGTGQQRLDQASASLSAGRVKLDQARTTLDAARITLAAVRSRLLATAVAPSPATQPPLAEQAAEGSSQLDTQQRGAVLGDVIPIVFCRRVGSTGGVLISPPATEARFEDDASSNITASYHLVLAEGRIDSIQIRDVFQRACRVGSYTQTYNRRAGTFVPGNFIDNTPNLEAPSYCGTGGTYVGLSTMAFTVTIPAGFDQWNRQVHCFVRGGLWVTRILDSVTGPSNNVADLLLYLLQAGSRVAADQINTASFLAAAQFTETNGFWYNGIEDQSTNVRDWMASTLPLFLLRSSRINGKQALRPLLAATVSGAIDTGPVDIAFIFSEEHIAPDGFSIQYSSLAERKPFCVQVLWRQQPTDDIGLIRTTDVRYTGTAEDGPFEQHDLSRFCASENHAVKVGTYILSRRRHISHRLSLRVKPDAFNETLAPGDIVRVTLDRVASTGATSVHDYLYEVEQIGKSVTGEVQLELTEFPVDADRRSVVAQEVAAAVGQGILLPTGKSGVTCDVNSSSNTGVPADTAIGGWSATGTDANGNPYTVDWDEGGDEFEAGTDDGSGFSGGITAVSPSRSGWWPGVPSRNPKPARTTAPSITGGTGAGGITRMGDELGYTLGCEGGYTEWRLTDNATGGYAVVSSGVAATYIVAAEAAAAGKTIVAVGKCPDPSSPDGYGPEITSSPTVAIVQGFTGFLGSGSYLTATLYDLDTCTSITGTVVALCNPGSTTTGTVVSSTGTYASSNPVGSAFSPSAVSMPVVVSNTLKHINPNPACGTTTGFLVRIELS
jgi:hypothetical protein